MHALVLLCINQYANFEMPSFTNYKDMIGAKFKRTGHVTLTTPLLWVVCHRRLGFDTVYLRAKSDDSSFSRSRYMIGASKFKVGHVTLITPVLRVICHPYAGT